MKGIQIAVMGEPHKDAWFDGWNSARAYLAQLYRAGYQRVGTVNIDGRTVYIMEEVIE